jgi:hypothetical protein
MSTGPAGVDLEQECAVKVIVLVLGLAGQEDKQRMCQSKDLSFVA